MKIMYIANARIPSKKAHGVQVMKMCEAFALLGHEVTLLAPDRQVSIQKDPFVYYGVEPIFKIVKLGTIDTVRFGKTGFLFHKLVFSLVSAVYVARREHDVAYARDEMSLYFLSFFSRKIVWESHMGRFTLMAKWILRKGCKLVVITNSLKDFYMEKGVPSEQILVAHDAVDLEEFDVNVDKHQVKERLGLPQKEKIAMYVGALKEWKGYQTLIEATAFLAEDVKVVIMGGKGEHLDSLRKSYPQVLFVSFQPYKELSFNQRAADVLVVPNLVTDDPFELYTSPLKVFAHMASGVPIVASDAAPLREVLSDKNAFIFKAGDPEDLAEKIKLAVNSPDEGAKRARQAKFDVEEYTWRKRAKSILEHIALIKP